MLEGALRPAPGVAGELLGLLGQGSGRRQEKSAKDEPERYIPESSRTMAARIHPYGLSNSFAGAVDPAGAVCI
jgi:hypothetical protein